MSAATQGQPSRALAESTSQKLSRYLSDEQRKQRLLALAERNPVKLERILTVAEKAVARNPKLQECSIESLLQAITDAVEVGLEPSGFNGEAYLIPRKRKFRDGDRWSEVMEAHYQLSYKGEASLASDNGWEMHADVIKEGDHFLIKRGAKPVLEHEYGPPGTRLSAPVLYVYACATQVATGYVKWECLDKEEVDRIRDDFGYADGDAWKDNYEQMAKKTAVHRLKNLLQLSPKQRKARDLANAFYHNESETVRARVVPDNEPPPRGTTPSQPPEPAAEVRSPHAADGGSAPTPSPATGSASSSAPAPSRTKKSKVSEAMAKRPADLATDSANVSPCPDCIPGQPPCAKHSVAVAQEQLDIGYVSQEDQRRLMEQDARAKGLAYKTDPEEFSDDLAKTNRAQTEIEATISRAAKRCDKAAGCAQDFGHAGFCAGPCKKTQGCAYWNKHPGECKP